MPVSIDQLGYKKLTQIIFEWQAADRASLFALFIVIEVALHWLWCLFVWFKRDTYGLYVNMDLLYPVWIWTTVIGLFSYWIVGHVARIKTSDQRLHLWQIILVTIYTVYIAIAIVIMGYSSLLAGVSLVGGAMLGMMLIEQCYIWRAFLAQTFLILFAVSLPYFGIALPNLSQLVVTSLPPEVYHQLTYNEVMTIENAIAASNFKNNDLRWDSVREIQRSSAFFWRSTHMYLALPKAIFIVAVFRVLLLVLYASKDESLKQANQDDLTHLKSRRHGLEMMQQALRKMSRGQSFSIILLDLDNFKDINDEQGHDAGDRVLQKVSAILSKPKLELSKPKLDVAVKDAIVSRHGGEEFLVVLPNTAHNKAMSIAEQLRQDIAQHPIALSDNLEAVESVDTVEYLNVTASFGVYSVDYEELTAYKITSVAHTDAISLPNDICQYFISIADKALYKAKHLGRNQVVSANELLVQGAITKKRYCK
ncbi:GGDEF domain-containing protein [Psychrobacter sp. T6-1]|uniref:GGDEF domain-containing protein n=1 Tax=Psychrobacter sp. T6-1 TaxID=3457447 RepID=UPI003FD03CE7